MAWEKADTLITQQRLREKREREGTLEKREVIQHEKKEEDVIGLFFMNVSGFLRDSGKKVRKRVLIPKEIPPDLIQITGKKVLYMAKQLNLYKILSVMKDDIIHEEAKFKGFANVPDEKIKTMKKKYERFLEEFQDYMEYWEHLEQHGKLPGLFSGGLSRFNNKNPQQEKRRMLKEIGATSIVMSKLISSYGRK